MRTMIRGCCVLGVFLIPAVLAAEPQADRFGIDPGWEGFRNRLVVPPYRVTRQDFGFRESGHARGKRQGEVGGKVQRSVRPAYYGKVIGPRTLNDKLMASGKFAVTHAEGGSGVMFGWFHEDSRGWRTPNSLGFRIDGNGGKYWVFFEYGTRNWLTGGMGCFEGERYQTTPTPPFRSDGTVHEWALSYDPNGAGGQGQIAFILDGKRYTQDVLPGHKADGATFNRFGIWNVQTTGDYVELYVDDLVIDGVEENFDRDPKWEGKGNVAEFEDRVFRPLHDFGHGMTKYAGGQTGEIGGIVWRDERPMFYGKKVGPFTLEDELEVSGKISFNGAGSDSGVYIGWFDAESKRNKTKADYDERQKNMLAVMIEGPSRIGHYFRPAYANGKGEGDLKESGPIIRPDGKTHAWSMKYDPKGAEGKGRITVMLDGVKEDFDLRAGVREKGARFDRFGVFNIQAGGHFVEVYLDDLTFGKQEGNAGH